MANIRVDVEFTIKNGTEVSFTAPCDCSQVTGLKVYHQGGSKEFAFTDSHGNVLHEFSNVFAAGAVVKVILDVSKGHAYIQNADTNAYLENRINKAAPVNLLDNSDFRNPVNQRGLTVYKQDAGYSIDRWKMKWSGDGELKVNDGYITLYRSTNCAYVFQNIPLEKKLIGKTVTVAARVRGSGTVGFIFNSNRESTKFTNDSWTIVTCTIVIPNYDYSNSELNGVELATRTNSSVDCEWIALYEGEYTAETLPDYHPKGYGAELLECQRYYRVFDSECIGNGYTTGSGNSAIMCIPFTMRIASPTVVGKTGITCRVNGGDYACDTVGVQTFNGVTLRMVMNAAGAPSKHSAAFYSSSTVALSADL